MYCVLHLRFYVNMLWSLLAEDNKEYGFVCFLNCENERIHNIRPIAVTHLTFVNACFNFAVLVYTIYCAKHLLKMWKY